MSQRYHFSANAVSFEAMSAPIAIFRNKDRHSIETLSSQLCGGPDIGIKAMRAAAWQQTQFANNFILEKSVPSYLLHDFLVQDMYSRSSTSILEENPTSTITQLTHENVPVVAFASGKDLNEIIIQDMIACNHIASLEVGNFVYSSVCTIILLFFRCSHQASLLILEVKCP
jgi:hypothetical protein